MEANFPNSKLKMLKGDMVSSCVNLWILHSV